MTTISIPYFSLSEPEVGPNWSNQIWNEIRVPLSSESSPAGRSDRHPSLNPAPTGVPSASQTALPAVQPSGPRRKLSEFGANPSASRVITAAKKLPTGRISAPVGAPLVSNPARPENRSPSAEIGRIAHQPTQAIDRLTQCILDRFPIAGPTIILFAGTQSNSQTSATCANVAHSLANKSVGEVLLVDSSSTRELTNNYQAGDHRGLSNLLLDLGEWKTTLVKLSASRLDFLPAGNSHWEHWGAESKLRELVAQLRRQYQYICVAADEPLDTNSKIWTNLCDGSFLLVSLTNANQAIAESAVVELQTCGARLLGCVVTDADTLLP